MATFLKGIDVVLHTRKATGEDPTGAKIYEETDVTVSNVLVGTPSQADILYATNMESRKVSYSLGIPKGDTNTWEGASVTFFGERFKVIGHPTEGIEAMIPLDWNKRVLVERIE